VKKDELTSAELERLMALETEVKADFDAQEAAKRAADEAAKKERARVAALEAKKAALIAKKAKKKQALAIRDDDDLEEKESPGFLERLRGKAKTADQVSDAMSIAVNAKKELEKPREKGEKSLLLSGGLSMVLGPFGWLYAGAWRESIPAAAAYLAFGALATKVPLMMMLVWPVLMVALPISGIAGMVYAWQYNRNGHRTKLFGKDEDDDPKLLKK
jgi:hypothetical protein